MTDQNEPAFPTFIPEIPGIRQEEYISGLSKRDKACIDLCVPKTGKPWMDELINDARRDRARNEVMLIYYNSILTESSKMRSTHTERAIHEFCQKSINSLPEMANFVTNAMLKASGEEQST